MWRRIGAASSLAFCTIHGSAPSSIKMDLPLFIPIVGQHIDIKQLKVETSSNGNSNPIVGQQRWSLGSFGIKFQF